MNSAALTGMVVVAVLLLSGCASVDPHVYDRPRAVATQLDAASAGHVLYTGTYGTGGFSSDKPTLIYVYAGREARATLEATMRRLGYTPPASSQGAWDPPGMPHVTVQLSLDPPVRAQW